MLHTKPDCCCCCCRCDMEHVYIKILSMKINHCIRKDMTHKSKVTLSSYICDNISQSNPTFHRLANVNYGSGNIFWTKFHCRLIRYGKTFCGLLCAMCNQNIRKYFHLSLILSPIVHSNFNFNKNGSYFFFHQPIYDLLSLLPLYLKSDIFIYPKMNDKWLICANSGISYTVCSKDTTKLLMLHYSFDLFRE